LGLSRRGAAARTIQAHTRRVQVPRVVAADAFGAFGPPSDETFAAALPSRAENLVITAVGFASQSVDFEAAGSPAEPEDFAARTAERPPGSATDPAECAVASEFAAASCAQTVAFVPQPRETEHHNRSPVRYPAEWADILAAVHGIQPAFVRGDSQPAVGTIAADANDAADRQRETERVHDSEHPSHADHSTGGDPAVHSTQPTVVRRDSQPVVGAIAAEAHDANDAVDRQGEPECVDDSEHPPHTDHPA